MALFETLRADRHHQDARTKAPAWARTADTALPLGHTVRWWELIRNLQALPGIRWVPRWERGSKWWRRVVWMCVWIGLGLTTFSAQSVAAQDHLAKKTDGEITWTFASVEQGSAVLTTEDDYVKRLSRFDRSARLKTESDVNKQQHLDFTGKCVLQWTPAEKERLTEILQKVQQRLTEIPLPVGEEVLLIKTSGNEEGHAPYTRANAIVIPKRRLNSSASSLTKMVFHELFHIASRKNEGMRDTLYALIGFDFCGELIFPASLADWKLTNPDAPINQHCIEVTVDGEKEWVVPILYSRTEKYDEQRGGEFFSYLKFELLIVERDPSTGMLKSPTGETAPKLVSPTEAEGFMKQIGSNTGYIIHPEEILADNFALLAIKTPNLPSPEIIDQMKQIILSTSR